MEDSHTQEVKSQLEAMGFPKDTINIAYEKSPIKTVEGVINYIDANPQINNQGGESKMDVETDKKEEEAKPQQEPVGESITPHINTTYRD